MVDRDDDHVHRSGLLFVPSGRTAARISVHPRAQYLPPGIGLRCPEATYVDPTARTVYLADGTLLPYVLLVVADGAPPPARLPGEAHRVRGQGRGLPVRALAEFSGTPVKEFRLIVPRTRRRTSTLLG